MRAVTTWLEPGTMRDMGWHGRKQFGVPVYLLRDYLAFAAARMRALGSADIEPTEIRTVCIVLGPYRNLTTLTASIVMLHPACQVLNHAATRLLPLAPANFLLDYSDRRFDTFVRYALLLSTGGRRGDYGGSILHSHAFDDEGVRRAYRARFGDARLKPEARSLIWKDSMRLQNYIRRHDIDLEALCASNERLRFLLPIRHPIDCAISNARTGKARFMVERDRDEVVAVLDEIVRSIAWFMQHRDARPDRFLAFTEADVSPDLLNRIAAFLAVEPDPRWLDDTLRVCRVRPRGRHPDELVEAYQDLVARHLEPWPDLVAKLRPDVATAEPVLS